MTAMRSTTFLESCTRSASRVSPLIVTTPPLVQSPRFSYHSSVSTLVSALLSYCSSRPITTPLVQSPLLSSNHHSSRPITTPFSPPSHVLLLSSTLAATLQFRDYPLHIVEPFSYRCNVLLTGANVWEEADNDETKLFIKKYLQHYPEVLFNTRDTLLCSPQSSSFKQCYTIHQQ